MIHVYPFGGTKTQEKADVAFALVDCKSNGRNPASKFTDPQHYAQYLQLDAVWDEIPRELVDRFDRAYKRYDLAAVKGQDSFESLEEVAIEVCIYALAIVAVAQALHMLRKDRAEAIAAGRFTPPPPPDGKTPFHRKTV